jgi:hypothetical protein
MSDRVIEIRAGELVLTASLNDSETSSDFWDALPISGRAQIWGDEIYFRHRLVRTRRPIRRRRSR